MPASSAPPLESPRVHPDPTAVPAAGGACERLADLAMHSFVRGVALVVAGPAEPRVVVARGFSSLSLSPTLCTLVVPAGTAGFEPGARITVCILAQDQAWLHRAAASTSTVPAAARLGCADSDTDPPRLEGCAAWFRCTVARIHPAGPMSIVVGEVLAFAPGARPPLLDTPDGPMTTEPLDGATQAPSAPSSRGGER